MQEGAAGKGDGLVRAVSLVDHDAVFRFPEQAGSLRVGSGEAGAPHFGQPSGEFRAGHVFSFARSWRLMIFRHLPRCLYDIAS